MPPSAPPAMAILLFQSSRVRPGRPRGSPRRAGGSSRSPRASARCPRPRRRTPSCSATQAAVGRCWRRSNPAPAAAGRRPSSAPSARTASAAHTELSTPPDIATTTPRRCSVPATACDHPGAMRSTSAAGVELQHVRAEPAVMGPFDRGSTTRVMRRACGSGTPADLSRLSRFSGTISSSSTVDPPGLLEEHDQLEEAGGVDDVLLHERVAVARTAGPSGP